jgi:hypothetical protein
MALLTVLAIQQKPDMNLFILDGIPTGMLQIDDFVFSNNFNFANTKLCNYIALCKYDVHI